MIPFRISPSISPPLRLPADREELEREQVGLGYRCDSVMFTVGEVKTPQTRAGLVDLETETVHQWDW